MMMELFNDYGTFTYKILQNKNKKFSKKQNKKFGHTICKTFMMQGNYVPYLPGISIGLHAEKQILTNPKNMVLALTRMLLKDDIFFPLKACGEVPSLD
jgi:hypothetical protein